MSISNRRVSKGSIKADTSDAKLLSLAKQQSGYKKFEPRPFGGRKSATQDELLNQFKGWREIAREQSAKLDQFNLPEESFGSVGQIGGIAGYNAQTDFSQVGYAGAESEAVRGVEQEFSGMEQRESRNLGRMGISPTSGRARSGRERRALNLALARAGARLEARKGVDELNLQRETTGREQALALRSQDITSRGQDVSRRGQDVAARTARDTSSVYARRLGLPLIAGSSNNL